MRPEHRRLVWVGVGPPRLLRRPGLESLLLATPRAALLRMPPRGRRRSGGRGNPHQANRQWRDRHQRLSRSVTGTPDRPRAASEAVPLPLHTTTRPLPFRASGEGGGDGRGQPDRQSERPMRHLYWLPSQLGVPRKTRGHSARPTPDRRGRRPPPRAGAAPPTGTRQHVSSGVTPPGLGVSLDVYATAPRRRKSGQNWGFGANQSDLVPCLAANGLRPLIGWVLWFGRCPATANATRRVPLWDEQRGAWSKSVASGRSRPQTARRRESREVIRKHAHARVSDGASDRLTSEGHQLVRPYLEIVRERKGGRTTWSRRVAANHPISTNLCRRTTSAWKGW